MRENESESESEREGERERERERERAFGTCVAPQHDFLKTRQTPDTHFFGA